MRDALDNLWDESRRISYSLNDLRKLTIVPSSPTEIQVQILKISREVAEMDRHYRSHPDHKVTEPFPE